MWKCDRCNSTEVEQEFIVMLPMNRDSKLEEVVDFIQAKDFFWCTECEDECDPILDKE